MLDQETKRKIDNARDILVGKVPDPKSQVEQITIALIYKFMDDMDKESEEWGGKPTFFTGEYKKYAWSRIFDPRLGGFDLIGLYSDAIVRMNQNPNIPQLFRDIFKNAYLPYRDPETLKSFLKEINEFTYDHSERLGDAFEYLLSVMDSQGEAGQFRTPRHIIDFIVEIVDPKKNETVLDPACGTAGFLISSYRHILKTNTKDRTGDQLTPNEKKRLMNNFTGYDISPDMVRLSLVNLYLHGFSDPKIHEYDTLTSEERWNETSDVVLANPPFMSPKGGIRPHKRFSIQAKRSEVLFVDYIAEHLNPNGRAGVIVPEGIIFQSQTAYKNLRKMLVEDYLWAVVSMPAGVFNPYSGVKTSILLIDKTLAKKTDKTLFVKIENDGFDLGAQRRPIDKNDLPKALDFLTSYKEAVLNGKEVNDTDFAHAVEKSKIAESKDWNLSGERYQEIHKVLTSNYEWVKLGEICQINPPKSEVKDLNKDQEISFLPMKDLKEKQIKFKPIEKRKLGNVIKGYTYFRDGDVLLAKITPCFENGKSGIAENLLNGIGFGSTEYIVFRPNGKILPEWIYYFISSDKFLLLGEKYMTGSAGQQRVAIDFVNNYKIPLPPLDVQKAIVAEIDGYQKIIDGARQVLDNYKPTIKIDPDWEMVMLGDADIEIIDGDRGKNYPKQDEFSKDGYCVFLNTKNVLKNGFNFDEVMFITKEKDELLRKGKIKRNDIVLTTRGTIGNVGIYNENVPYSHIRINSGMLVFRHNSALFFSKYIFWLLQTDFIQTKFKDISSGTAQPQLPIRDLVFLKIPLPPLSVQQEIVAQIEAEQEMVNANKKLIEIYEQKIKDKIKEVWGE